jgi:tetratricopeptide (TPR) repeat protein
LESRFFLVLYHLGAPESPRRAAAAGVALPSSPLRAPPPPRTMGLLRSLSKSLSVGRRRGDDHDKDTALRKEAQSLLRRGETDSALEVIERGLDEASARLLDENDETHEHDETHERNLIHLHSLAAKCHHEHKDYREACVHFIAALDVAGDRGPEGFPDVFDHAFFLGMGDACHMRDKHGECVFAHEKGLELLLAETEATARREASEAKKKPGRAPSSWRKNKNKNDQTDAKFASRDSASENTETDSILKVGSSKTHHQMAVSLRHLRDFERALDHLGAISKPLEAALGAGDVLCEMESCFRELGLFEEAETCLRRAASEAPAARADNVAKIATFRRENMGGDARTCVEELERCLAMAAKSAKIEKARFGEKVDDFSRKDEEKDTSKTHDSERRSVGGLDRRREARVRVLLGQALCAVAELKKAEKHLGAACAKAPEDPQTWLALASFYRETERDDLAMPALRKAAALGEVPRDLEAERLEEEHRKANALKREMSMRGGKKTKGTRLTLSLKDAVGNALAATREKNAKAFSDDAEIKNDASLASVVSSTSARVLDPQKSGRLRQNLARAAERAEMEKQLASEAEALRLQKVKGKGSFSARHKKTSDFVDPNLLHAREKALGAMAAIFESHGQTGRAMEVYASMDQNDARVVKRQEEILTEAALKLQRTFRGKKAREEFERRRKTRRARRVYGSADGFTNVQTFTQGKQGFSSLARNMSSTNGALDQNAGRSSKPLGSSFF